MRILHNYIARNILSAFMVSLLVLSFIMMIGLLFKATGYIAKGADPGLVLRFLALGFPGTLAISIPISALVSTLLVFGRLSSDSEISAMRSCGVSMRSIMLAPFLIAGSLSVFSLYINAVVAPNSAYSRREVRRKVNAGDILSLIEPGRYIDEFPGASVYVDSRDGDLLRDVRIIERNGLNVREIRAETARVSESSGAVCFELNNVTIDPVQDGRPGAGKADRMVRVLGDEKESPGAAARRRIKDCTSWELMQKLIDYREFPPEPAPSPPAADSPAADSPAPPAAAREKSRLMNPFVELSRIRCELSCRVVLSLAALSFVLVAVPFGLKSNRRESAIGTTVCIAVAVLYYLFLIVTDSLSKYPKVHPEFLPWIPVVLAGALSFHGIRKTL